MCVFFFTALRYTYNPPHPSFLTPLNPPSLSLSTSHSIPYSTTHRLLSHSLHTPYIQALTLYVLYLLLHPSTSSCSTVIRLLCYPLYTPYIQAFTPYVFYPFIHSSTSSCSTVIRLLCYPLYTPYVQAFTPYVFYPSSTHPFPPIPPSSVYSAIHFTLQFVFHTYPLSSL